MSHLQGYRTSYVVSILNNLPKWIGIANPCPLLASSPRVTHGHLNHCTYHENESAAIAVDL
jgi:hypothetical protein